jgi:RNA polymerase sigma factor (sigma-70 family)
VKQHLNLMGKPHFKTLLPIIDQEILKRKARWTLTSEDFDDVAQKVRLHVFEKYKTFDPNKGEFTHWLNKLISNRILNILRDEYTKVAKPCVLGCSFNTGDGCCSHTPSGKQCSECKLYKKWQQKKEVKYNLKQTLPLENHTQEVENVQSDFINIEESKKIIDIKIKAKLKPIEWKIYQLLYIDNKSDEEVAILMDWTTSEKGRKAGYQQITNFKKIIIAKAKKVIDEEIL